MMQKPHQSFIGIILKHEILFLKLQKDFEEDKQQAVSRAMANMNREIERTKQSTEEKCKKEYMEEMKKLAAKHKDAISATKRKQWVSQGWTLGRRGRGSQNLVTFN